MDVFIPSDVFGDTKSKVDSIVGFFRVLNIPVCN